MPSLMKSFLLSKLLPALGLAFALSSVAAAQDEEPGSGGTSPLNPPTGIPIDGGVSLLLAGGVAYGVKKLRDRRRKV